MEAILNPTQWAERIFGGCELGDRRRTRRLVKLAAGLARHTGCSVNRSCEGDGAAQEGAYRWLRNPGIGHEQVLAGGFESTVEAASGRAVLVAVEDSTVLSFRHCVAESLGDTGGRADSGCGGVWVHTVLLVDGETKQTVGLVEQALWHREGERGVKHHRRRRPEREKESDKWRRASERMAARLGPEVMKRVISVCDRESDIYGYLSYKRRAGQRFVVRAAQDRRLEGGGKLFEVVGEGPVLGRVGIELGQRGGRSGRRAKLEVGTRRVRLCSPKHGPQGEPVEVNVVWAREASRRADALEWVLLTSEEVGDLAAARRVLEWYRLRWRIEEFHKAWKSGAGVEAQRLQKRENLLRLATVLAFVAVRLLQLREVVEGVPGARCQPCTQVLGDEEWRVLWLSTARRRPPAKPPSLGWAYQALAKLGGFIDTKRTGRAGWSTLWEGWFLLNQRIEGFRIARELDKV